MATIFPKKRLRDKEVADAREVNKNVTEALREAESNLGEHNWAQGAFTSQASLETGAAIRCASVSHMVEVDANVLTTVNAGKADGTMFLLGAAQYSWATIEPTGTETFPAARIQIQTGDSILWIMFSCQLSEWAGETGAEFALAFDGNIIPETITGTTDRVNDTSNSGFGWAQHVPVSLDAVIPCVAGNHTLEAKVRSGVNEDWKVSLTAYVATPGFAVSNFDFIVTEMK